MVRSVCLTLIVVLALPLATGRAAPARAQSKDKPSVDEQLRDRLRAGAMDDVDRELFGPRQDQPARKDAPDDRKGPAQGPSEDMKQKLSRELGAAAVREGDDPRLSIARQMREVESLIAQARSGEPTQQTQEQILAELDKLIQQARKRCRQCNSPDTQSQTTAERKEVKQPGTKPGGGRGKSKSKAARDSTAKPGQSEAKKPELEQVRAMIEEQLWGDLPPRQRQQLLQLPMEEFLPKYESLIIEYFQRLSEEQGRRKDER